MTKKKSSPRTPSFPAPAQSQHNTRRLKRAIALLAFLPPLADALLLLPICQMTLANLGAGVLSQLLSVLSELLNLSGFFAIAALAVYCVFINDLSSLGWVFAMQGSAYLLAVVLLRPLMQLGLAALDSSFDLPFAFSNLTLNTLKSDGGVILIWSAIQYFITVIILMALLLVLTAVALLLFRKYSARQKVKSIPPVDEAGEIYPPVLTCFRVGTLIYLAQALINQIVTTVKDLQMAGITSTSGITLGTLAPLIAPYFLLAIYTFFGYELMQGAICLYHKKWSAN